MPDTSAIVEDLFLTSTFLIKGRLANKYQRLRKMLEDLEGGFLQVHDAAMVSLNGNEVIHTPQVLVNPAEVILAHELVDVAGDGTLRDLSRSQKSTKIRAFYSGVVQLELTGKIKPGAYKPSHDSGRKYFIMQDPVLKGLDLEENRDLRILNGLSYAIVHKEKLAYVYDFS